MHAQEHREEAEQLLEDSADTDLYTAEVRDRMVNRAHVHALIFVGLQFAMEHDPTATGQHIVEEAKRSADLHLKTNPRRPVSVLNIPARLDRRRGNDAS